MLRKISAMASMLLLLGGFAWAESLEVEVNRGALISNADSSDLRLLMLFALPQELNSAKIYFAELRVPITSVIPDSSALTIYCRPLLMSWVPDDVRWDDIDDRPSPSVVSRRGTHFGTSRIGPQTASFDITPIFRKWKDGTLANNGLIVYANPGMLSRFDWHGERNTPFAGVHVEYQPR